MKLEEHILFARSLKRDCPLVVRRKGSWVWDEESRKYLDGCAGANVNGIGHGVAKIGESMARQAAEIAYATPQACREQCLDLLKKARGLRFMLSPGCEVPAGTSDEVFRAFCEAPEGLS